MKTIVFTRGANTLAFPLNSIRSIKMDTEYARIYVGELMYLIYFSKQENLQNGFINFLESTVDNTWSISYDTFSVLPTDCNFGLLER